MVLSTLIAASVALHGPDLTCHYEQVHGRRSLTVSRKQWEGIRRPSSRVVFAAENNRLIIQEVDVTMEPD